jgi:hypothetical protein
MLIDGVTEQSYVVYNLVTSYTYFFKVRARNAHDYGDFSEILGILVA